MQAGTDNPGGNGRWILVICGYFAFQALYRWLPGGSLGLDEAQILLEGQALKWGYGPQPPLYAWLQWGAFRLIPDPLLAMAVLKNALLAGTYLAVYFLFRTAHRPEVAGLAALGLMLVPQFAWESQRALTHSVLATSLAAATYLVFWTRVLAGRRGGYALFGLLAGLGLLAKINYALVPVALVLAAFSMAGLRCRLKPAGLLASAAIAAALVALPLAWMWRHPERVLSSAHKFDMAGAQAPLWQTAAAGLAAVVLACAMFLALAVIVTGVIRWRFASGSPGVETGLLQRFLLRAALFSVALVLAAVLAASATSVKDRWMQPALFALAPVAVVWMLQHSSPRGARALSLVIAGLAVLVAMALPAHNLYGAKGRPARRSAPVALIAAQIAAEWPGAGILITRKEWLAGNLFYARPDWQVQPLHSVTIADGRGEVLLVWAGDRMDRGGKMAEKLRQRTGREVILGEPQRFSAAYPYQPQVDFTVQAVMARLPPEMD